MTVLNIFRYRDNFDVVLINDAAEITQPSALKALIFPSDSIIIFGDGNHYPKMACPPGNGNGLLESNGALKSYVMNNLKKYFFEQFSIIFYPLDK